MRARLALGAFALALTSSAMAQVMVPMDPAIERQIDEAYRQILQQPQDLAAWSRYARLQVQGGNYEGGIGALERLLLQPNVPPEVPLEIGVLYYRLGSYAAAQSMIEQALKDPRLSAEGRALGENLLRDARKNNQKSVWKGNLLAGLRSQSNPGYRTSESQVLSGGVLGPLGANQRPERDWDVTLGGRAQHLYDLDMQNSGKISSTFGAFLVDYHKSSGSTLVASPTHAQDLLVLDANVGFDFKPSPANSPGLNLRPHVAVSHVAVQRHDYLRTAGVGLDLNYRANEQMLIDATLDVQRRSFQQRVDLVNPGDVSGHLAGLRVRVLRELAPGRVLVVEGAVRGNSTGRDFYDYGQQDVRVTYSHSYAGPAGFSTGSWTTSVWLGALHRDYDAPDPGISPTVTRKDSETRVGVSQVVPFADQWFGVLSLEHVRNRPNLPNFRYRNTSASVTVMRTF